MARHFGFEPIFMPVQRRAGLVRKSLTYLRHAYCTFATLAHRKPSVVWLQLPQIPLLWVALAYKFVIRRNAFVIADCHNALFRSPWREFPLGISLLRHCDAILVHNADVVDTAIAFGVKRTLLSVVEDPPASFDALPVSADLQRIPRPWLVFPASFAPDEPVAELLAAAKLTPSVSILFTGDLTNFGDRSMISAAPANAHFLGLLPRQEFEALIVACDAVVAFTHLEAVQLSACGEAIGAGKPMLASGTRTLRRLLKSGAVFVDSSNPDDISTGIVTLFDNRDTLAEAARQLSVESTKRWLEARAQPLQQQIRAHLNARFR